MPFGMEVGLGPGDFVFDGDPAPFRRKDTAPLNFWPIFIAAKRLDGSRCHLVTCKPPSRRRCLRWGRRSAKRGTASSFRSMSIVAKRLGG